MLRVGITGGIGSGKSTVCKIFELLGVPVYNADGRAKWLMANNLPLQKSIVSNFGEESFLDGELNRKYLAEKVFKDDALVERLNALVHPVVAKDFNKWCSQQDSAYVLKEAALLIESGSSLALDVLILVAAPIKLRIERIKQRDPYRSLKQIEDIMNQQVNLEEARALADFVIDNDESKSLIGQVLSLHKQIIAKG